MSKHDEIATLIMQKVDLETISSKHDMSIRQLQRIKRAMIEKLAGRTDLTREERQELEDSTRTELSELSRKIDNENSTEIAIIPNEVVKDVSVVSDKLMNEVAYNSIKNLARLSREKSPTKLQIAHQQLLIKTLTMIKGLNSGEE